MDTLQSMDDQFLTKINQLIDENLSNEHFSVEDLAQRVGLSRSMLHRKLIKLTGKSASDLITEKRLMQAKDMLENNVATASEIAYKVGFNSPSYFNKVFKAHYKVSPGDIRKGVNIPVKVKNPIVASLPIKHLSLIILTIVLVLAIVGKGLYYLLKTDNEVEKSIAILPFDNLSSNSENQYFADGIVEDLLNRLSKIEGLKVISRTSSEIFRDKGSKTIPEIAELLGVNYILEGTVQRETNNVRINIQLIDAKKDNHVLSQQYDRNLSEVFKIQSEIADQIVKELSLILDEQQAYQLKKKQTNNLKAFEYKQLGRYFLNKRTKEDTYTSIHYFRNAITEDPEYALAYAEMADAYFIASWYKYKDFKVSKDSAVYLSLKALELDKNIGEAYTVLGVIYDEYDWKYSEAEKEFKKAIQINPNHSTTYQYYSEFLFAQGKMKEARQMMDKAVILDPYSYIIRFANALLYLKENNYSNAISEYHICKELAKDNPGSYWIAFNIYLRLNNEAAAIESFIKQGQITGLWTSEEVDSIYQSHGFKGLMQWRLQIGKWVSDTEQAHFYALLGEDEKALDIIENAVDNKTLFPFETGDPEFVRLQSNPRYNTIRKKMGLPPL